MHPFRLKKISTLAVHFKSTMKIDFKTDYFTIFELAKAVSPHYFFKSD